MTEDQKMRRQQFIKSLALASAAFKTGDYKEARYWLDGAHLVLASTTVERRREQTQHGEPTT